MNSTSRRGGRILTHVLGAVFGGLLGLVLGSAVGVFWFPESPRIPSAVGVTAALGSLLGGVLPRRGLRIVAGLFRAV